MNINYIIALNILEDRITSIIEQLKNNPTTNLLIEKKSLDSAIKWLKKGEEFNIDPNKQIISLPQTQTKTPSSEFRIIEDNESDKIEHWEEVKINDKIIRPLPGSWIILN